MNLSMQASYFFLAAAFMSIITFYVHTFIGGPVVVTPLLASKDISKASKWLNYYCWHNTTIVILAISVAFFFAAFNIDRSELAVFSVGLSGSMSLLSAVIAFKGKINPFRFPSTSLFASVCLLGSIGLFFL